MEGPSLTVCVLSCALHTGHESCCGRSEVGIIPFQWGGWGRDTEQGTQNLNSDLGCGGWEGQERRPWNPLLPGLDSWLHCRLAV